MEEALQRWVSRKEELGVFAPIAPSAGPYYRSGEIVKEVEAMLKKPPLIRAWYPAGKMLSRYDHDGL
jgi:hypothetical protein